MGDGDDTTSVPDVAVPTPRTGRDEARGLPGTRAEWVTVLGQVSSLLLALRRAEAREGAVLPAPLAGGRALRAWGCATRRVRPGADQVAGSPADVAIVGHAARVLGHALCRAQVAGVDDDAVHVLRLEAGVYHCTPEWLVAQLARVHGVLSASRPASAHAVWRALEDPD
jgi:hypothetical protein